MEKNGMSVPADPAVSGADAIGIARNQVHLYHRRRNRDSLVFDPEALERLEWAFAEAQPRHVGMLDYLEECVQSLDGRARTLCELRYERDLKPAAIAPRVGMSANSVAKALQRIREMLWPGSVCCNFCRGSDQARQAT